MSIRRQFNAQPVPPQYYVIVNKEGEVFTGLIAGIAQWSEDWKKAKILAGNSTDRILKHYPGTELIKEEELA